MTLDHASGDVDGAVLSGSFAGMRLSGLSREEIMTHCARTAPPSIPTWSYSLDNYLDRRFPGWGTAGEGDANAGGAGRRRGAAK